MKILALILCICTLFTLTSCDMLTDYMEQFMPTDGDNMENDVTDKTPESDDKQDDVNSTPDKNDAPMTSTDWENAIATENFNNITFSIIVNFPESSEPYSILCKIDGDRASMREENYAEQVVDKATRDAIYSIYISTVLSIVENFDSFTYDSEAGLFTNDSDIVYTVQIMEYDATITCTNTKVKIDGDKNIAEISCGMKQEFVENGKPDSLEFDAVFSFYDYGTTVVPEIDSDNNDPDINDKPDNGENNKPDGDENINTDENYGESDLMHYYQASCGFMNVTMNVYAIEALNDGTEQIDEELMKTTATALSAREGMIYSIEDGTTYVYMLTESGWEKNYVQSNAPIGTLLEMYVGMFQSIFDDFEFNPQMSIYSISDVTLNIYGSETKFDFISIEVRDGTIYELRYVMDTYGYVNGEYVVHGKGYATLTFTDYGTTVVELPTEYREPSKIDPDFN